MTNGWKTVSFKCYMGDLKSRDYGHLIDPEMDFADDLLRVMDKHFERVGDPPNMTLDDILIDGEGLSNWVDPELK